MNNEYQTPSDSDDTRRDVVYLDGVAKVRNKNKAAYFKRYGASYDGYEIETTGLKRRFWFIFYPIERVTELDREYDNSIEKEFVLQLQYFTDIMKSSKPN